MNSMLKHQVDLYQILKPLFTIQIRKLTVWDVAPAVATALVNNKKSLHFFLRWRGLRPVPHFAKTLP